MTLLLVWFGFSGYAYYHRHLIFLYPFILRPALPVPLPSTLPLVAVHVHDPIAMRHDFRSLEWDEEVPD